MARTYEQEKAYCERRARDLSAEMEAALESGDAVRFREAYSASFRYLGKKQRKDFYFRFLERSMK